MATVERDGCTLYYESEGTGETVCFVSDLGWGAWQWGWQHAAVAGPFEALAWDLRGTGRSDRPAGPYSLETLVADLEAVLSAHGSRHAHLVGAGLGGLVALEYARTHGRARSLTLVGTNAGGEHVPTDPVSRLYAPRSDPAALRATLEPVLTADFIDAHPDVVDGIVAWRAGRVPGSPEQESNPRAGDADEAGWRAQAAALAVEPRPNLYEVTVPALVIHGTADQLWPVAGGRTLAAELPRGTFQPVEHGPHLVGVERSREVNDHLVGFLESHRDE